VAEGNDVPLELVGVKIQQGHVILWTFGAENCLVARADSETIVYNNERFGNRVELNPQTGSLTIKDIKKKTLDIINYRSSTQNRPNSRDSL